MKYPIIKELRNVIKEIQYFNLKPNTLYRLSYNSIIINNSKVTEYSYIYNQNIYYDYNEYPNYTDLDIIIADQQNNLWWLNIIDNAFFSNNTTLIDKQLMHYKPNLDESKILTQYINYSNYPNILFFKLLYSLKNEYIFENNHIDLNSFNDKQIEFIRSKSKFATLTAVAGSGKTTTIVGRVNQMIANNINSDSILLTTFTKNSAKELKDRTGVESYTIDSITLQLLNTKFNNINIINEIQFDALTGKKLKRIPSDELFTNTYPNVNEICNIINEYGMITYELATILLIQMVLQKIIIVPFNHIVIDEAQDTSILQMILMLAIAYVNNASLYLIGDEPQSLYEFRNAIPQLMFEFKTISDNYILDKNYRSTDQILKFANKTLRMIKNSSVHELKGTDKQGPDVKVKISNDGLDFSANDIKEFEEYIKSAINNNESICILTGTMYEYSYGTNSIYSFLKNIAPVNILTSEKFKSILEQIKPSILDNWNEFNKTGVMMAQNIINKIDNPDQQTIDVINKIINNDYNITKQDFIKQLINYELEATDALSVSNENRKNNNNLLNIGTIHSTKGLEFDHTIILINENNKFIANELQAFYKKEYVAFTRARLSEIVIIKQINHNILTQI